MLAKAANRDRKKQNKQECMNASFKKLEEKRGTEGKNNTHGRQRKQTQNRQKKKENCPGPNSAFFLHWAKKEIHEQ